MSDKRKFADTNVLVYAFDSSEPKKQKIAQNLLKNEGSQGRIVLSTQVLQEFFVVITRKLPKPLSLDEAYNVVSNFAQYPLVQVDKYLILRAIKRTQSDCVSFWDALIIESALETDCEILLSEDMQTGRKINEMTIENPFS
jgi:predicted nucleic acid-binding protein